MPTGTEEEPAREVALRPKRVRVDDEAALPTEESSLPNTTPERKIHTYNINSYLNLLEGMAETVDLAG